MKIGIMGDRGSFSEEAANQYAQKNKIKDYQLEYLINAKNVLKNLDKGIIDLGIVAFKNTLGGEVIETKEVMPKYNFKVIDEIKIKIRHFLLAKNVNEEEIIKIISHNQSLKQCRNFLKNNFSSIKIGECDDQAKAAKNLPKGVAVIAPKVCAKLYNLNILEEDMQDSEDNITTFLVLTK